MVFIQCFIKSIYWALLIFVMPLQTKKEKKERKRNDPTSPEFNSSEPRKRWKERTSSSGLSSEPNACTVSDMPLPIVIKILRKEKKAKLWQTELSTNDGGSVVHQSNKETHLKQRKQVQRPPNRKNTVDHASHKTLSLGWVEWGGYPETWLEIERHNLTEILFRRKNRKQVS